MSFIELDKEFLRDMIRRRDELNSAIVKLEESLSQPPYQSHIDYKAISLSVNHDKTLSAKWAKEREDGSKR